MSDNFCDFFSSAFTQKGPKILLNNYNENLLKSTRSLLNSVEKTLHIGFCELKDMLSKIETGKKINQKLYAIHASFQDAVRQGSTKSVLQLIKDLEHLLSKEEIYATPFSIQTISCEDWEQQLLKDLQAQNCYSNGKLPSLVFVEKCEVEEIAKTILESLELLRQVSPLFYNEFETYTANLKLFQSDRLVGMTDVRAFGTVYLCIPKGDIPESVYFCEHIIHEVSHLHLHTLFAIDKLVLNAPSERYTAPIRPDPRPMYGIFHATFVLSRMVRIFMLLTEKNASIFEEYFELFLKRFLNGVNTIKQFGKLTPLGEKIMESYSDITALRVPACV